MNLCTWIHELPRVSAYSEADRLPLSVCLSVRNCLPRNSKGVVSAIGSRAFSVSGPQTWNQLPEEITSAASLSIFQRHLKTFLFRKSFPDIIADWHRSGPCGNLNYLGHSKKFCLIDWLLEYQNFFWLQRTGDKQESVKFWSSRRVEYLRCTNCPSSFIRFQTIVELTSICIYYYNHNNNHKNNL